MTFCVLLLFLTGCEMIKEDGSLDTAAFEEAFQEALKDELGDEVAEEVVDILQQAMAEQESAQNGENSSETVTASPVPQLIPNTQESGTAAQLTEYEVYEYWHSCVGYWNAAGGWFAVPDMEDSHTAVFRYGLWETEFATDYGRVIELTSSKEGELTALVEWDDGAQETIMIDYSGLDQDGKIRIKIGNGEWSHYMNAGATEAEAYQTYLDNTYGGMEEPAEDPYWPECEYTNQLAKPSLDIASATVESDRINIVFADSVSHADIIAYAATLQDVGFNIDLYIDARAAGDTPRYSFIASNAGGYQVELYSNGKDKTMCIRK